MPYGLNPDWTPETNLFAERAWLLGFVLTGVTYGIVIVLTALTLPLLYHSMTEENRSRKLLMMVFVVLIFSLTTLFFGGTVWMDLMAFVDYRLYPGGPAAFEVQRFSLPVDAMAVLAAVLTSWLADALIIWRVIVVYASGSRFSWVKRCIPIMLYIIELILGGLWMAQASSASAWDAVEGANFTAPYFWYNLTLHLVATASIVGRLLYFRSRIEAAGPGLGSQYIGIAAMVVESDALYSTILLLFLIPFQLQHPIQGIFIQLLGTAHIIPSLLIVYRVASGKAWSNDMTDQTVRTAIGDLPSLASSTEMNILPKYHTKDTLRAPPMEFTSFNAGLVDASTQPTRSTPEVPSTSPTIIMATNFISSPIYKLPDEMIVAIMLHAVTGQDIAQYPATVRLTQVSRRWRMIVNSSPALWASITTLDSPAIPTTFPRLLKIVQLYLEKSDPHSLAINADLPSLDSSDLRKLFDVALNNSHRLRSECHLMELSILLHLPPSIMNLCPLFSICPGVTSLAIGASRSSNLEHLYDFLAIPLLLPNLSHMSAGYGRDVKDVLVKSYSHFAYIQSALRTRLTLAGASDTGSAVTSGDQASYIRNALRVRLAGASPTLQYLSLVNIPKSLLLGLNGGIAGLYLRWDGRQDANNPNYMLPAWAHVPTHPDQNN
ncbi:hypothetical protein ONZ45_g8963 [Pleurotus djamor]|nr:hypothetical protein ONZ45_g8963 [Pleurotus djamor]